MSLRSGGTAPRHYTLAFSYFLVLHEGGIARTTPRKAAWAGLCVGPPPVGSHHGLQRRWQRGSVPDAEVADEGDRVAVGIPDGGQLHTLVYGFDGVGDEATSGKVCNVIFQVIDGEVQQG